MRHVERQPETLAIHKSYIYYLLHMLIKVEFKNTRLLVNFGANTRLLEIHENRRLLITFCPYLTIFDHVDHHDVLAL